MHKVKIHEKKFQPDVDQSDIQNIDVSDNFSIGCHKTPKSSSFGAIPNNGKFKR